MKSADTSTVVEQRELTPEEQEAFRNNGRSMLEIDHRRLEQQTQLAEEYRDALHENEAELLIRPRQTTVITEDDLDFVDEEMVEVENTPITPIVPTPMRRSYSPFDYTPSSGNNWYTKLRPNEPKDLVDGAKGIWRKSCGVLNRSRSVIPDDNARAGLSKALRSSASQPIVFSGEFTWKMDADYQFNLFTDRDIGSSVNGNIRIGVLIFDNLGPATRPFRMLGGQSFKTINYSVGGGSLPQRYPTQNNLAHYGRERASGKTTSSFAFRMQPRVDYYVMFHVHAQVAAHNAAIWWLGTFEVD